MKTLVEDLWLENRSLAGPGFTKALERIQQDLRLTVHEFPSGQDAWTWRIPNEWSVNDAYFENGTRYADFKTHPLHLWSYSLPFDGRVSRDELLEHVVTDPERPDLIPYEFRYYDRDWGFSMTHNQLEELRSDWYDVLIDTVEKPGALKVGEHVVPGETDESVLVVSHLCHPGQANDDLAGVTVAAEVARRLAGRRPRLTIRFLFVPEHIGTVAYLARHENLIPQFRHGVFLEMLGLNQPLLLQRSRRGDTPVDRAARLALQGTEWSEAGFAEVVVNDERVLDGPGVEIPTVSLSRATGDRKQPFPEYHTSGDTPDGVSEHRLEEAAGVVERLLDVLDRDVTPRRRFRGTPHLSRYNCWVTPEENPKLNDKLDLLIRLLEGDRSASEIAVETGLPFNTVRGYLDRLEQVGLVAFGEQVDVGFYRTEKPWGHELVLVNGRQFVKLLMIQRGECSSLHYHNFDKVMVPLVNPHGGMILDGQMLYGPEPVRVPRGVVHREWGPQELIEMGEGDPSNVTRLEDKYGRT